MIVVSISAAVAQDTLLSISYNGKLDSLNSAILKQKRYVQVFLPSSFKPGTDTKYDVMYVFDGGNWNMGVMAQLQRFIERESQMPPVIIVSVMGIDRNIELTPTHLDSWQAPTGGAGNFLAFIKDELIPYINKKYPSNGDNTIWGHSLGGMFVLYALLQEPKTFRSYIAVDPSLWWDDHYIPRLAATKLPALTDSAITLFISGREGPDFHGMGIDTMETVLKTSAPSNLSWNVVAYKNETHSSVRMRCTYDGLKFTYEGYNGGINFLPMSGIIAKDSPVKIFYYDDTLRVHYTLDGTIPVASSPQALHQNILEQPAHITFKRLTNRSRYDRTASGEMVAGDPWKAFAAPGNLKPGGFHYDYYEGSNQQLSDRKGIQSLKSGVFIKDFDFNTLPRKNDYLMVVDGMLEIKEAGYYVFFFKSGTGSKFHLGNKLLMQWSEHEQSDFLSYIVPLSKGFYPLHAEFFTKKGDIVPPFYYLTPANMASADAIPIPADVQYHIAK